MELDDGVVALVVGSMVLMDGAPRLRCLLTSMSVWVAATVGNFLGGWVARIAGQIFGQEGATLGATTAVLLNHGRGKGAVT
jgi:NAD/NADP transhydrogenase beta subunit